MKRIVTILSLMLVVSVGFGQNIPNTGNPLTDYAAWGFDQTDEIEPNNRKAYVIQRHYGLSLSAHTYYGGIRFYNQGGGPIIHITAQWPCQ
ncbi:MAG: hypothetical protein GY756_01360 [bacterium]|nr:hypothetical protein [bacterium]